MNQNNYYHQGNPNGLNQNMQPMPINYNENANQNIVYNQQPTQNLNQNMQPMPINYNENTNQNIAYNQQPIQNLNQTQQYGQQVITINQNNNNINNPNLENGNPPLSNLRNDGEYNNLAQEKINDNTQTVNDNKKKNTIKITAEGKVFIIIILVILAFIFILPYIFDLIRDVKY